MVYDPLQTNLQFRGYRTLLGQRWGFYIGNGFEECGDGILSLGVAP